MTADLLPLPAPGVRRLLRLLLAPAEQQGFCIHGSRRRWRRQGEARQSHYGRRLAGLDVEAP